MKWDYIDNIYGMNFLYNFKKWNINEKMAISEYEDIQNEILDKVNQSGVKSLTKLEKEILDAISKEDIDFIRDLKSRGDEYSEILSSDFRDEFPDIGIEMDEEELFKFNVETLWDLIDEIDLEHFLEIYNYPIDVIDFTWEKLPPSVQKDFIEYSLKYK